MGGDLDRLGQPLDGIESPRQERQRRDDEIGDRRDVVEFLRPDAADGAQKRQHQRRHDAVIDDEPPVLDLKLDEEAHGQPDDDADGDAPRRPAHGETEGQFVGGERRHQGIDDVALNLGDDDRRRGVGEGVLGDGHDDQARGQEFHERHAGDGPDGAAKRQREDRQKQQRRHHRRHQGLGIDLDEAPDLAQIERPQPDPVDGAHDGRVRWPVHGWIYTPGP